MTQYAHTTELKSRGLPLQWTDPATGNTIMGLSLLSDAELAALGWYPVVRAPLELGASGWEDLELGDLDTEAGQWVRRSKPGYTAEEAKRRTWAASTQRRQIREARQLLATTPSETITGEELKRREAARDLLGGI